MSSVSLDTVIKNLYDRRVKFIRSKNIELERKYFLENSSYIPLGQIIEGTSFDDHFKSYKTAAKNASEDELGQMFDLLQEYFLFSAGNDMMFKMKLEADAFVSLPIDELIYPGLVDAVKEKYCDVSVMREHPNLEANLDDIDKMVYTHIEAQSLLYLLYCNDFHFPKDWEELFPDTQKDILRILNDSGMTIGDFLHALIDFKCGIMSDVFGEIVDPKLRSEYLKKVESLKEKKHEETSGYAHVGLPVTYFLDHTFLDFLLGDSKPAILEEDKPSGAMKILLPNNCKKDN